MASSRLSDMLERHPVLIGLCLVLTLHCVAALLGLAPGTGAVELTHNWGPDSYSRVLRVLRLHETGQWFDPVAPYFNAPYGLEMHWTRTLDLWLYTGAWLGSWVIDFRTALVIWATFSVGPLLHLCYVPALRWATRRLLPARLFPLAVLLLLSLTEISALQRAGFIDIHGFLVLLLLLQMGLVIELIQGGAPKRLLAWFGVSFGIGIWFSVEAMLLSLPALLAIAALWVIRGDQLLADARVLAGVAVATLAGVLVIERAPSYWLQLDYDRVSVLHLLVALVMLIAAMALSLWNDRYPLRRPDQRALAALLTAAVMTGGLLLAFPGLAGHPQQDLGPLVAGLLDSQPGEQPYFSQRWGQWLALLWELGPLLWVLPYSLHQLIYGRGVRRLRFAFYLLLVITFLAYTAARARGIPFLQVALLLPWIEFALVIWGRLPRLALPLRWMVVTLLSIPHQLAYGATHSWYQSRPALQECDYQPLAEHLSRSGEDVTVLAPLFEGPQLVFDTGIGVISSPYHRNRNGIEQGFELLWGNPDSLYSRRLAQSRRLEYVVICRSYFDYGKDRIAAQPNSLIGRLERGAAPDWLVPLNLPSELAASMLVYQLGSAK